MSWIGRAARVTAAGTCVGLVGLGLSAVKVLPGLELMGVTNRAGGLSLEDASGFIREFTEPALFRLPSDGLRAIGEAKYLFPVTITVAGVGLIVGLYQRATRWLALAGLLLVVSGIAIAHSKFVFGLLWHVMPMFRFQRIPQRALVLAYLGLGLLVSIGARQIVSMLPRAGLAAGSGVVLMLAIAGECLYSHPPLPPTADIRQEVKENQILNHLAKEPGRFRIHAVESADRNWGIEHVTVPLGLSNLAGWDHLWLLEYLGAEGVLGRDVPPFLAVSYESRNPARFWGLMNVRFITATRLIQASSLRLVGEFPVSPRCQPRKSAGPYLYENLEFMPRAWLAPQAILVLGDRSQRQQAAYQLMDHPSFDPHRVAVIQSDHSEQWIDEFSDYNAVILPRSWLTEQGGMDELEPHKLLSYDAEGGDRRRRFQWTRPQEVTRVLDELAVSGTSVGQDVAVHSARSTMGLAISPSGYARLELPGRAGFLVLAEKIARFPGWRATTDAGPRELLHANGVASAVRLDGSESVIEFRYRPAGLVTGLCISIVSLVIAPVLYWLGNQFVARWRQ
jgi:hypothetical protein